MALFVMGRDSGSPATGGPVRGVGNEPIGRRGEIPTHTLRQQMTSWCPPSVNDGLIYRDNHPYMYSGTEVSGRLSGNHDPQLDGPNRPEVHVMQRAYNWTYGTFASRNFDPQRNYNKYGYQDGSTTVIYGGEAGYYLPYGQRGTSLAVPPARPGPSKILAGPPHGLHTDTAWSRKDAVRRSLASDQMKAPRQDRLSNSRRAGQSYSQLTRHQGGTRV